MTLLVICNPFFKSTNTDFWPVPEDINFYRPNMLYVTWSRQCRTAHTRLPESHISHMNHQIKYRLGSLYVIWSYTKYVLSQVQEGKLSFWTITVASLFPTSFPPFVSDRKGQQVALTRAKFAVAFFWDSHALFHIQLHFVEKYRFLLLPFTVCTRFLWGWGTKLYQFLLLSHSRFLKLFPEQNMFYSHLDYLGLLWEKVEV